MKHRISKTGPRQPKAKSSRISKISIKLTRRSNYWSSLSASDKMWIKERRVFLSLSKQKVVLSETKVDLQKERQIFKELTEVRAKAHLIREHLGTVTPFQEKHNMETLDQLRNTATRLRDKQRALSKQLKKHRQSFGKKKYNRKEYLLNQIAFKRAVVDKSNKVIGGLTKASPFLSKLPKPVRNLALKVAMHVVKNHTLFQKVHDKASHDLKKLHAQFRAAKSVKKPGEIK